MKLIIQMPCFNEADTLAATLQDLPRSVEGFDSVEWLVINDGSMDKTEVVAKAHGVNYTVRFNRNQGLARAFMAGLDACIKFGADVIVNTDADNQYNAADIHLLVEPILSGRADIVIGVRPIDVIQNFSFLKKVLQKLGSWVVSIASRTTVADASSGFRAISRDAAMRLNVFNEYTYTLEMIIQAGQKNITLITVPVRVNAETRPSRLVKSIPYYIKRSILTIIRVFVVYRPFRFFMSIGLFLFSIGFLIGARFLYYFFTEDSTGHVQSLILASVLLGIGFQTMLVAFLADLLSVNRRLMEDTQYRIRKIQSREKFL